MPQDVPMGQGYMGDALLAAFPGQYRASEPQPTNPVTYLPQPPGAAAGRPSYTDPDQGRTLKLVTMPGVGQVVVPVDHTMVGMNGPVVPVDYSMVGIAGLAHYVSREDLSGLGHHHACAWGVNRISKAAGTAAHEALVLTRQGKLGTPAAAQAHIQAQTAKIAALVTQKLQAKLARIPAIVAEASAQAWKDIAPMISKMLARPGVRAGLRGGL
jgi:hypothetical protein